jgi:hypothetical protein
MARRRYKSPAISSAGRQEKPPDAATEIDQPMPPRSEYGPQQTAPDPKGEAPHPQSYSTGLGDQIAAQRAYASDPLNAYLDQHFSGATPHERQWLKANPRYLQNPMLTHHAAMIALQRGVPRHSPEFLQFIGALLDQHHAAMQAPPAPMHAPAPPPPPPHQIDLEAEHEADHDDDEPEGDHTAARYSAPVSRGEAGHSIEPETTSPSQVRLTSEQREAAHAAGISEIEYAKQFLKMGRMRKAGLIKE